MHKKILHVSANKGINFLLQTIFQKQYRLFSVSNVFQAAQKLRADKFEAVIVDVDFQPQQCWDLIHHIKSSRLFRVPVILLATENNDDIRQLSYEYEIDEIFFKPFNPVDLITAIQNLTTAPELISHV